MNHRDREIDTLFRRMAGTVAVTPDPMIAIDAARAVDEWPLLAMLTHAVPAHAPHHMMMAVDEPLPLATEAPAPIARAPEPEPAFEFDPEPEPTAMGSSSLSPLEQLFQRAERTGKPQSYQPTTFAPAEPVSAPLTAPPPLKAPAQPRLAPLTRPAVAAAPAVSTARASRPADSIVTIEPQPHDRRPLDTVPEHLFERMGAR